MLINSGPPLAWGRMSEAEGLSQFGLRGRIQTILAAGKLTQIRDNSTGANAAQDGANGLAPCLKAHLAHM